VHVKRRVCGRAERFLKASFIDTHRCRGSRSGLWSLGGSAALRSTRVQRRNLWRAIVSLLEQLTSDDDLTRLLAAEEAARTGGPELVDVLLDLALHDAAEVQITGGVAERWENVSDAAATGLGAVLARQGGLDDRVRHAVWDLTHDDEHVSRLLCVLGDGYVPLRRELETSGEERLRLRALKAVLPSRAETDREVRRAFLDGLAGRPPGGAVRQILIACLADGGYPGSVAAARLKRIDDPAVAAAMASRVLVSDDEAYLATLVDYPYLLRYAPELRDPLEHLHRCASHARLGHVLGTVLSTARTAYPAEDPADDPAHGLDGVQRARLLREIVAWALCALGPAGSAGLRAWSAAPDDRTAAEWITDHDWFGTGAQADLLRAAISADVSRALTVEVVPGRPAELTRLAHLFTARQIRAGLDPLPPGRFSAMLTRERT